MNGLHVVFPCMRVPQTPVYELFISEPTPISRCKHESWNRNRGCLLWLDVKPTENRNVVHGFSLFSAVASTLT